MTQNKHTKKLLDAALSTDKHMTITNTSDSKHEHIVITGGDGHGNLHHKLLKQNESLEISHPNGQYMNEIELTFDFIKGEI